MSTPRRYWLMKSEPDSFSIDDLARVGTEPWNGVRNYQARNHMRQMQPATACCSITPAPVPGIAGLATVATEAYPDPTQFERKSDYYDPKSTREDPRWSLVDVKFVRKFADVITLEEIKQHADALGEEFALIKRGTRLSVLPVTAAQWKYLLKLEPRA
jgi:predicted RNA-binding protein with PUA-like domain